MARHKKRAGGESSSHNGYGKKSCNILLPGSQNRKQGSRKIVLSESTSRKKGSRKVLVPGAKRCIWYELLVKQQTEPQEPTAASACIYCGRPANSDEHAIPRFLGELSDFPHLKNRICGDCNIGFSRLEQQLARSSPEALMRIIRGIEGRHGDKGSTAFTDASSGAAPIEVSFRDTDSNARRLVALQEGAVAKLLPCIYASDDFGCEATVFFDKTITSGKQLLERLAKAGVSHPTRFSCLVEEPDKPRLERVFGTVSSNLSLGSWSRFEAPSVLPQLDVKYHVTEEYYRAIAKVAFHYMLAVCPDVTGSEECFKDLRHYIQHGNSKQRFVSPRSGSLLITTESTARNYWSHLFLVTSEQGRLTVSMQLFIGRTEASTPIWDVQLNQVPLRPDIAIPPDGTGFAYVRRTNKSGYKCVVQLVPLMLMFVPEWHGR